MLTALGWKESRELLPLVALALAAQTYLVGAPPDLQYFYTDSEGVIPFVSGSVATLLFVTAGLAAFVTGLWQTVWELGRGTFHFLLHRPASRGAIFGAKLLVGTLACLAISALPVLGYALWAAAPGTHASPFDWSMTSWAWALCLKIPLVYFGAFLSGLHGGSWFGSRLFPVAASVLALMFLEVMQPWPLVGIALCLALEACFVWVILRVAATRDYS
jgi:ABC-type transport system involved in multi-copper enzyme maturation permease subunit